MSGVMLNFLRNCFFLDSSFVGQLCRKIAWVGIDQKTAGLYIKHPDKVLEGVFEMFLGFPIFQITEVLACV